jgi:hypothetical protein
VSNNIFISSVIRKSRRKNPAAEGPGLKAGGITEEKDFLLFGLHPEIVMAQGLRVHPSLVPPVQDFAHFVPSPQMNKSPGAFLPLVTGVGFDLDVFKDPLFFHNFFHHRGTEDTEKKQNSDKEKILFF